MTATPLQRPASGKPNSREPARRRTAANQGVKEGRSGGEFPEPKFALRTPEPEAPPLPAFGHPLLHSEWRRGTGRGGAPVHGKGEPGQGFHKSALPATGRIGSRKLIPGLACRPSFWESDRQTNHCMSILIRSVLAIGFICLLPPATPRAETEAASPECHGAARFIATAEAPSGRHYAPDREVQVLHLALEIPPDMGQSRQPGSVNSIESWVS